MNEEQKSKIFEKEILTQIQANLIKDNLTLIEILKNGENGILSSDKILDYNPSYDHSDSLKYWLSNRENSEIY